MFPAMRGGAAACIVLAILVAAPAPSSAGCLDFLFGGCCGSTARTTYMPPYVAPACGTCAPQTCQYVPQTCYRTVYQAVPVTTCQPITACDPCTRCPVTTLRPITSWIHQVRLVPYTTFRVVYANPCAPCASCGGCSSCAACGPTTYAAPAATVVPAAPCASCAGGVTTVAPLPIASPPTLTPVPGPPATVVTPPPAAGPSTYAPAPSAVPAPSSSVPGPLPPSTPLLPSSPNPADVPPSMGTPAMPGTYTPPAQPSTESRLLPIPKTETPWNATPAPALIDPENRTTSRPVRQASFFQLIASPARSAAAQEPAVNDGAWRASHE